MPGRDTRGLLQGQHRKQQLWVTGLPGERFRFVKRELQQAFGNVSRKLNELIERELAKAQPADWRDVLKRKRPLVSDEDYAKCLRPE